MEPSDVRRIAFVTRRFGELQGLVTASAGAGLLAAAALAQYGFAPRAPYFLPLMLIAIVLMATAFPYLTQLYRESYGAVSPRLRAARAPIVLMIVQVGILCDAVIAPQWGPSLGAVGVASYAALIVARDRPWRLHYLVVVAAGVTGVAFSTAAPASVGPWEWFAMLDAARGPGLVLAYGVIGFSLIVAGALDHHLLNDALSPVRSDDARRCDGWARAGNGGLRALIAGSIAAGAGVAVASRHTIVILPMAVFLPLALMVPLVISIDTYRGKMRKRPPRSLTAMVTRGDVLSMIALGTALTLDVFVGVPRTSLVALALAGGCAWVVVRDWPLRPHYLVGCGAALFSAFRYPADAARVPAWFCTFLFLTCVALTIESLLDYRMTRRSPAALGATHADAL
jgi:hypothetical protein